MSPTLPKVVLYRYNASPFSVKVDNLLKLKKIPHSTVAVANALPRPEITDLLGVTYRRIPILAIGNDIYCDTSLIAAALERRFPPSLGFGTLFPPKKHGGSPDTGLLKAFTTHYSDTVLFRWAQLLLPWNRFPESFLEDRRMLGDINVQAMLKSQPKAMSVLTSHLALINEQLQDGREWLFDTELPSLADIGVEFAYNWVRGFKNAASLFDENKFPFALKWLDRMRKFLQTTQKELLPPTPLSGVDAADVISNSPHEPYEVVGFDLTEASRLNIKQGETVSIVPDDAGLAATGKLVALNLEEVVIETKSTTSSAIFRVHFPRINYTPKVVSKPKL